MHDKNYMNQVQLQNSTAMSKIPKNIFIELLLMHDKNNTFYSKYF